MDALTARPFADRSDGDLEALLHLYEPDREGRAVRLELERRAALRRAREIAALNRTLRLLAAALVLFAPPLRPRWSSMPSTE